MLGNLETSDNVTENHIIDKHYVVQWAFSSIQFLCTHKYTHTHTNNCKLHSQN